MFEFLFYLRIKLYLKGIMMIAYEYFVIQKNSCYGILIITIVWDFLHGFKKKLG